MEQKKNTTNNSKNITRSDKLSAKKNARIEKTIRKLNTRKKLEKDFYNAPDVRFMYSFKDLIKSKQLHFYLHQKEVFANKNKDLSIKKIKINPTSIFKIKNSFQKVAISVLVTAALFGATYGAVLTNKYITPLVKQAYMDYKTSKLPEHKESGSYDFSNEKSQNIIENKDFENKPITEVDNNNKNNEENLLPTIKIDSSAKIAYANLLENLNETFNLYIGDENTISPVFGFVTENDNYEKIINLVCKTNNNESVFLQFDVYDETLFFSLFGADTISSADAINNLNLLLDSGNITDLPQVSNYISYENSIYSHTTPISKYTEKTIEYDEENDIGVYKETDFYKFQIIKLEKNGVIKEEDIKISVEDASKKLSINDDNLQSIYDSFVKNPKDFYIEEKILEGHFNIETTLFLNALKTQTENLQKNSYNSANDAKEFE